MVLLDCAPDTPHAHGQAAAAAETPQVDLFDEPAARTATLAAVLVHRAVARAGVHDLVVGVDVVATHAAPLYPQLC